VKRAVATRVKAPQSRANCQVKYCQNVPSWPMKLACRSNRLGLPYCTRLSTSLSAWLKKPTGSPSLIGGYCPARIGSQT